MHPSLLSFLNAPLNPIHGLFPFFMPSDLLFNRHAENIYKKYKRMHSALSCHLLSVSVFASTFKKHLSPALESGVLK